MATIAEQLTSLADAKSAIKGAIVSRGVSVSDTDPLRTYADKIGQIGETVPETRFGVGIGNLLGTVDADGNYVVPSEPFEVNLAGIKSVPEHGFSYAFFDMTNLISVNANDVTSVGEYAFQEAFSTAIARTTPIMSLSFDNLEVVDSIYSFYSACTKRANVDASFKKLKKVTGNNAFKYFATPTPANFDKVFPSLEEIAGDSTFASAFGYEDNCTVTLTKLKKITGKSSKYYSIFGDPNRIVIWNFPNATEFTGYIWGTSFAGEIHFAAANQAAIEACEGYSYKWGFTNATIYFDL